MDNSNASAHDTAPGEDGSEVFAGLTKYFIGLGLAIVLTVASFWAAGTGLIYGPAVPIALAVLAIAQMGVHLVFFLRITTAPDNTNNILALAFGILIVTLVVAGSLWIMSHLDHNMMPVDQMIQMQR
jgi:cytochrome o ubiquinol oxidase subunit IV